MPQRPRIVVVGSINMDLVVRCDRLPRPGETIIARDAKELPGGKGANQAVAAARLGAAVAMVGRVGSDAFADRLVSNLQAAGVDTTRVQRTGDCASGLAIVSVDRAGENSIIVVPGANGRVGPDDVAAAAETIRAADVLLLQLEIPLATVQAAASVAREGDRLVILDPAPAPGDVPDGLLDVDIVCPNAAEAAALLGSDGGAIGDPVETARALTARGPGRAIVTLGPDGAAYWDARGVGERVSAPNVQAVDTTAAGDAFAAALGVRLAERAPFSEAVAFACRAGAVAVTRPGAQPAMPTRGEVERLGGR